MLNILYEDEAVLVVWKPVGMESQSGRGFEADMVSEIRRYLSTGKPVDNHKLSTKSVEPYVGVIHRLDKPVSGVMVYAKTKRAAAATFPRRQTFTSILTTDCTSRTMCCGEWTTATSFWN